MELGNNNPESVVYLWEMLLLLHSTPLEILRKMPLGWALNIECTYFVLIFVVAVLTRKVILCKWKGIHDYLTLMDPQMDKTKEKEVY